MVCWITNLSKKNCSSYDHAKTSLYFLRSLMKFVLPKGEQPKLRLAF
jgi:hypothetical protein